VYPELMRGTRPILLFGGRIVPEKLQALRDRTGLNFEWVPNDRNGDGARECANVCKQLRNGRFSAMIILNELISHPQSEHLMHAAKSSNTLHAIGKKGGTGAVLSALNLFERQLSLTETTRTYAKD